MAIDLIWEPPSKIFNRLDARANACIDKHSRRLKVNSSEYCYVRGDYLGWSQIDIFIRRLEFLTSDLVVDLRNLLVGYPRWQINVVIAVMPLGEGWPDMGLYIREREIIDGLQRAYFPPEFQNLRFEGARPGGEAD